MSLPSAAAPASPHIDVYERTSATPGYKFFAVAHPVGLRAVTSYGDNEQQVVTSVQRQLGVGS